MASESNFRAHSLGTQELLSEVEEVRQGNVRNGPLIDEWLRWGQRDDPFTNRQWAWLAGESVEKNKRVDRDGWVLDVWRGVRDDLEGPARKHIEKEVPWSFYQRHFFGWFLGRFDIRGARAVFIDAGLATRLHLVLVALLVAVPWASLGFFTTHLMPSLGVFSGLLALVGLLGLYAAGKGLLWYAYLNSLSPRLAAAVGIGYLFFFSAPHLVVILNNSWRPASQLWLGSLVLVGVAFTYLTFHISRRVHPKLAPWELLSRSGAILALALAYASLGLLVAGPMLFSQTFLSAASNGIVVLHPEAARLAFCAAVALNLGVILQLAWDEKPLTEPL